MRLVFLQGQNSRVIRVVVVLPEEAKLPPADTVVFFQPSSEEETPLRIVGFLPPEEALLPPLDTTRVGFGEAAQAPFQLTGVPPAEALLPPLDTTRVGFGEAAQAPFQLIGVPPAEALLPPLDTTRVGFGEAAQAPFQLVGVPPAEAELPPFDTTRVGFGEAAQAPFQLVGVPPAEAELPPFDTTRVGFGEAAQAPFQLVGVPPAEAELPPTDHVLLPPFVASASPTFPIQGILPPTPPLPPLSTRTSLFSSFWVITFLDIIPSEEEVYFPTVYTQGGAAGGRSERSEIRSRVDDNGLFVIECLLSEAAATAPRGYTLPRVFARRIRAAHYSREGKKEILRVAGVSVAPNTLVLTVLALGAGVAIGVAISRLGKKR